MSNDKIVQTSSHGIGLSGMLGILFIGLKLGHVITWPWIWVLAPFWIGVAVGVTVLVLVFAILCIALILSDIGRKKR